MQPRAEDVPAAGQAGVAEEACWRGWRGARGSHEMPAARAFAYRVGLGRCVRCFVSTWGGARTHVHAAACMRARRDIISASAMRRATALLAPPTCLPLLLIMASSSASAFSPPLAPRARLAAAPAAAPSLSVAPPPASRAGILRGGEAAASTSCILHRRYPRRHAARCRRMHYGGTQPADGFRIESRPPQSAGRLGTSRGPCSQPKRPLTSLRLSASVTRTRLSLQKWCAQWSTVERWLSSSSRCRSAHVHQKGRRRSASTAPHAP